MKSYTIDQINKWIHELYIGKNKYYTYQIIQDLSEESLDAANGITDVLNAHTESENKFVDAEEMDQALDQMSKIKY